MIDDSVPAAEATVCTMLFSCSVAPRSARRIAIEITAAGIDVANVRPALSPKYTLAAVNTKVMTTPRMRPRRVSSGRSAVLGIALTWISPVSSTVWEDAITRLGPTSRAALKMEIGGSGQKQEQPALAIAFGEPPISVMCACGSQRHRPALHRAHDGNRRPRGAPGLFSPRARSPRNSKRLAQAICASPKKNGAVISRAGTLGEEFLFALSCNAGSELLHVHHVPEPPRHGVLRVEGVGEGRV